MVHIDLPEGAVWFILTYQRVLYGSYRTIGWCCIDRVDLLGGKTCFPSQCLVVSVYVRRMCVVS